MSKTQDKSEFPAIARKMAERLAERMPKAYEASVRKYLDSYERAPNEDDFCGWLEGYDWSDDEEQR